MKEVKIVCPSCGNIMTYKNYWSWVLRTIFHWFNFLEWRDYRRTKCTKCGKVSYMKRK